MTTVEDLRHQLKKGSEEVGRLKRDSSQPASVVAEKSGQMKAVGDRIGELEESLRGVEDRLADLALRIPNLPHPSVPVGKDATENVEARRYGQAPKMSFSPKPHWELGEALGILNFERATKIAGARFAVLTDAGARLERAMINYMLDLHTARHGYREVIPPFLVNRAAMTGTGQLPKFEDDLFRLADEDFFSDPDRGGAADQSPPGRDLVGGPDPAPIHRLHPLFPAGSRVLREGYAGVDPPPPI